jgi:hypothetical protein
MPLGLIKNEASRPKEVAESTLFDLVSSGASSSYEEGKPRSTAARSAASNRSCLVATYNHMSGCLVTAAMEVHS